MLVNSAAFRGFLQRMIDKRRSEMAQPGFVSKGDFLTMLLQNDLFSNQVEYMIDECLTFMLAGTQTTTLLVSNIVYYMTQ